MLATPASLPPALSRRDALRRLGLLLAGAATAGCAPLRIALNVHPESFDTEADLTDRVLRAFVATVVPGVPLDDANLIRAFQDPYYPFAPHRAAFAADLCRRAGSRCGNPAFDRLTIEQRTAVIQDGLRADFATRKLYGGAVFLAQIATYAAIYDDEGGTPFIGFEGRHRYRGPEGLTYPHPEHFLARPASADGNPA